MSALYSTADDQKRAVGEAAAALVEDGMTVGLGTGSTAAWFVRALGARGLAIRGVPTSTATARLAAQVGIPLTTLDLAGKIDLTVDGADEMDAHLNCIKGGGGALLREKLVWEASRRVVVIADAAKRVERLGAFSLPVEVAAFGHVATAARLKRVLAEAGLAQVAPKLRGAEGEPFVTDGGNLIYDLACGKIADPAAMAAILKQLTGVVEHGLFIRLAHEALIGTEAGVARID